MAGRTIRDLINLINGEENCILKVLDEVTADIKEMFARIRTELRTRCPHEDNGGFIYGFCKFCDECSG